VVIPLIVILVGSRKAGIYWTILSLVQIFIISNIELLNITVADISPIKNTYTATLSILILLTSSLIYFFEKERVKHQKFLVKTENELSYNKKLAALGTMSGGLAHEINNPLTVIKGNLDKALKQLNSEGPDLKKVGHSVSRAQDHIDRIQGIVNGMQSFNDDDVSDKFSLFDLNGIIAEVLLILEPQTVKYNIKVENSMVGHKEMIKGKPDLIHVLLKNILTNSIDEINEVKESWIKVELLRHEGNDILFTITDSGEGISNEYIDKVLDPFFTTKTVGKGAGLGLTICQNIAQLHQGKIYVNNKSENI
jgi:two-component system, NtrC family, sensor kinase